jgi:hypothetical protein
MDKPTNNPVTFAQLAFNSLKLGVGIAVFSVLIGVSAAYVFSRLIYRGAVLNVIRPNRVDAAGHVDRIVRTAKQSRLTTLAECCAIRSKWGFYFGALFAIWNLKATGHHPATEEAAASTALAQSGLLRIILPLAVPPGRNRLPGLLTGWTEFAVMAIPHPPVGLHAVHGFMEHDCQYSDVVKLRGDVMLVACLSPSHLALQKHHRRPEGSEITYLEVSAPAMTHLLGCFLIGLNPETFADPSPGRRSLPPARPSFLHLDCPPAASGPGRSRPLHRAPRDRPTVHSCYLSRRLRTTQGTDGYRWWNDTVFYEIFVRSFYDTDGDGNGDLNGLIEKLDYLQDLGVTGLWLMPIHPSPSYHGYDVTDYYDINPAYGTLDDFKRLLAEAKKRNIRIIIDFV